MIPCNTEVPVASIWNGVIDDNALEKPASNPPPPPAGIKLAVIVFPSPGLIPDVPPVAYIAAAPIAKGTATLTAPLIFYVHW